ncbi:hypothetical protein A9Z42_0063850 [Trichoderma parareesei]|uniref:Uncharacterized protein n=1 Tax=Trichoderma parareesei TaxID=858221 RepID=A0A2H2ZDI6_TRIPA|nr:hypothetical protein A9Z42_0063850 [Trichoderma parareesei]
MDQPLPQVPSVSSLDMAETLDRVLQQGTTVINDLSKGMQNITDPSLLSVLNELAMIVAAVANYLERPLCAVDRVVDKTSFEAFRGEHHNGTASPILIGEPGAITESSFSITTCGRRSIENEQSVAREWRGWEQACIKWKRWFSGRNTLAYFGLSAMPILRTVQCQDLFREGPRWNKWRPAA